MSRCKVVLCVIAFASTANAGVVVDLIPDQPGPYFGGESLTVDVWLESDLSVDVDLRVVLFDFSDTDPALLLDPAFVFDLSAVPSNLPYTVFPEIPRPVMFFGPDILLPPGSLLVLPGNGLLHIGSIGLDLPTAQGVYAIDALNADEPDLVLGGALFRLSSGGIEWRAYTGEITGGIYDFVVIPEPTSLALLALGAMTVMQCRRRQPTRRFLLNEFGMSRCKVVLCVMALASIANAGVVVELIPDQYGMYVKTLVR